MGAFYASAIFTIVVVDGESVTGLQDLRGISTPRAACQALIPFGEEKLITPRTRIGLGKYGTRGWTYQEYIVSQRVLVFSEGRMTWESRCCQWHEEIVCSGESHADHAGGLADRSLVFRRLPDMPDMMSLQDFTSDYSGRSFTYKEDALPGISGLLSLASRSFQGEFLCGTPEMLFNKAFSTKFT